MLKKITLSIGTLIVCCAIAVNGTANRINKEDDSSKSKEIDDAIQPQIQIIVKSYPKVSGNSGKDRTQKESNVKEENNLNLAKEMNTEIKGQTSDRPIKKLDTTVVAGHGIQNGSENRNSSTHEILSDSFLKTSVQEISNLAISAWSYITQAGNTTERPDNRQEEFTQRPDNRQEEFTDKVDRSSVKDTMGSDMNSKKKLLSTNLKEENSNEVINDYPGEDITTYLPVYTTRKVEKNRKYQNARSLLKTDSTSDRIRNHLKSRAWKSQESKEGDKILNMSPDPKEVLLVMNDQSLNGETEEVSDIYISDNLDVGNDDNDHIQANEPWFQRPWFAWDAATDDPSAQKEKDVGQKPEKDDRHTPQNSEADAELGSASSPWTTSMVTDDEDDIAAAEGPLSSSSWSYRPGISYNSFRPIAEADLRTSDVTKLINHYETCDTCMITIYNTSHDCPFYKHPADEFDNWARHFSDLLKYGCSGQGVQRGERCCHSPDATVQIAVHEVNKVIKSMGQVLLKQCEKCPADCVWSQWEAWSNCPVACDTPAIRNRSRSQIGEKYGGRRCHGESTQREECPPLKTEHVTWLLWSPWSSCSGTCGRTRHRTRKCSEPTTCSCFVTCPTNENVEVENCGDSKGCCYSRTWSSWSSWSSCVTTDFRTRSREKTKWRTCEADQEHFDQPMCPQPCPGPDRENTPCCTLSTWGEWSEWSECVGTDSVVDLETGKQCGVGCRNRTRECLRGNCANDTCYGDHIERIFCGLDPCCEPPIWTQWSLWSACSVSTGSGFRRRHRSCQANPDKWRSPICQTGGCFGRQDDAETQDCQGVCPNCMPPTWGSWEAWSDCDFTHIRPRRISRRQCLNLSWDTNCRHLQCEGGVAVREEACHCDDPTWTMWSQWGACDYTKVPPQRRKSRVCMPATNPSYCREVSCTGLSELSERCCRQQGWMPWSSWSECEYRGDQPRHTRTRTCSSPDPGCPDTPCDGSYIETRNCQLTNPTKPPPCDPGHWETWSPWSSCDCRSTRRRFRSRNRIPTYGSVGRPELCLPLTERAYEICEDQCQGTCEGRKDGKYPSCRRGCRSYITCCQECGETCEGRKDGKYPSCRRGCRSYITCCQGKPIREECKGEQQYDSLCQRCRRTPSPTCSAGQYDTYKDSVVIPVKKETEVRNVMLRYERGLIQQTEDNRLSHKYLRRNPHLLKCANTVTLTVILELDYTATNGVVGCLFRYTELYDPPGMTEAYYYFFCIDRECSD